MYIYSFFLSFEWKLMELPGDGGDATSSHANLAVYAAIDPPWNG
jgi:hypothetical protein